MGSVWLLAKNTPVGVKTKASDLSSTSYQNNVDTTNSDWKGLLSSTDLQNTDKVTNVSAGNSGTFDETTLTAQMARDLFSRYLLIANKSGGPTTDDADQIATQVLTSPSYTQSSGAVYVASNIKIISQTDQTTVRTYYQNLSQKMSARAPSTPGNPITILNKALQTESDSDLSKIEPFIVAYKGVVSDLTTISVPADATAVHLALLNAYSNLLSDTQAMRQALVDPVKAIAAINQYEKHYTDMQNALLNINNYFGKKLGQ